MEEQKRRSFDISSTSLHILAMFLMLLDHIWASVALDYDWLTCVGRLAFPIFAFMLTEGYFHTHNLRRYALRLFIFAVISEIPFNLIYEGSIINPFHQNVLWTLLIGLFLIHLNELAKKKEKLWIRILTAVLTIIAGYIIGLLTMVDYFSAGVLTILAFYFFRGRKWWCYLGQAVALYYLNVEMIGGYYYDINIFERSVEIVRQGLAVFALIPIWLYRGRRGYHSKFLQYSFYAFYPVHMLLLYFLTIIIGRLIF